MLLAGITLILALTPVTSGAALPPQGPAFPEVKREWAIEQVLPPKPDMPGNVFYWHGAMGLGDVDRDGKIEWYVDGVNSIAQTGTGREDQRLHLLQDQTGPGRHFGIWVGKNNRFSITNGYTTKHLVHLRHPTGYTVVLYDAALGHQESVVLDLDSGAYLGELNWPLPHWWSDHNEWAGDIDGDGWDDFFFQALGQAGLMDGRTRSVRWHVTGLSPYYNLTIPTPWVGSGSPPDIDQDGVQDYLASFTTYYGGTRTEFEIRALSGADGSTIWVQSYPNPRPTIVRYNSWGADASGDGFPDIYSVVFGQISAIDGRSGLVLWSRDERLLDDKHPPGLEVYDVGNPIFTSSVPGSDQEELIEVMQGWRLGSGNGRNWWHPVHLDRRTGQRLAAPEFPLTMEPWWWETFMYPDWDDEVPRLLGDIDRDGIVEIERHHRTRNYPGTASNDVSSFAVILGLRTLFVPATAPIGHVAGMTVSIPSGPGKSFFTLASTQFEPEDGLVLAGKWPTNLAPSYLLTRTLALRPLRGVLDARGEAHLQFDLPFAPSLVGTRIYTRVVVEEPGVAGGIWTLSTLGVTEVTQ